MPVMVLDVPVPAWNEVVLQSVMFGLDLCPDTHREKGNTIVEISGTLEKLQFALTRMKRRGPITPQLLGVVESKSNDHCR